MNKIIKYFIRFMLLIVVCYVAIMIAEQISLAIVHKPLTESSFLLGVVTGFVFDSIYVSILVPFTEGLTR